MSAKHIPALDGLRCVGVFLVIFFHAGIESVPGGHGVMLFFVVSGFLITWLLLKESDKSGMISLKGFFRRRILRIFPAFYVYALVTLILLFVYGKAIPWHHAVSSLLYFSNYYYAFNNDSNNAFSHTWSLAIEEQFYLLFPLLFLLFHRNLRRLTLAIVAIVIATWCWRLILVFGFNASGGYIYSAFDTRCDHILVGCLLAIVLHEKYLHTFWQLVLKNSFTPLLTILFLAFSIFFSHSSVTYKSTIGFALEPILIAVLIAQMIVFSAAGFWTWLNWRPIRFLGTLSYSLYLYQQLTTSFVSSRMSDYSLVLQLLVLLPITIMVAALSYYLIEMPFLQLKSRSLQEVIQSSLLKVGFRFSGGRLSDDV